MGRGGAGRGAGGRRRGRRTGRGVTHTSNCRGVSGAWNLSPLQAAEGACAAAPHDSTPGPGKGARTHTPARASLGVLCLRSLFPQEDSELWKCSARPRGRKSRERSCRLRGRLGPSEPSRSVAGNAGREPPCRLGLGSVEPEGTRAPGGLVGDQLSLHCPSGRGGTPGQDRLEGCCCLSGDTVGPSVSPGNSLSPPC